MTSGARGPEFESQAIYKLFDLEQVAFPLCAWVPYKVVQIA